MEWVEVADSAVKIGLTALITSVASYLVMKKNHRHEVDKENRTLKQAKAEESKTNYSQFLTHSLMLTQKYRDKSCDAQGSDYIEFLDIYNRVQITSDNSIALGAYNLLNAVNEFIVIRKNEQDRELLRNLRQRIDLRTGEFQCLAREYLSVMEKTHKVLFYMKIAKFVLSIVFFVLFTTVNGILFYCSNITAGEAITFFTLCAVISLLFFFSSEIQEFSIAGNIVKLKEVRRDADKAIAELQASRIAMFKFLLESSKKFSGGFGSISPKDERIDDFLFLYENIKSSGLLNELSDKIAGCAE